MLTELIPMTETSKLTFNKNRPEEQANIQKRILTIDNQIKWLVKIRETLEKQLDSQIK